MLHTRRSRAMGVAAVVVAGLIAPTAFADQSKAPSLALGFAEKDGPGLTEAELIRWEDERPEAVEFERTTAADGTVVLTVPHGCRTGSTYVLLSEKAVSEPVSLEPGDCTADHRADPLLLPRAEVTTRLRAAAGVEIPRFADLVVRRCASRHGDRGEALEPYPVRIDRDSERIEAAVPAVVCADLTLLFSDLSPVAWLGIRGLDGPDRVTLPPRSVTPGASVLVLVTDGKDSRPCRGCRVAVVPDDELDRALETAHGLRGRDPAWVSVVVDRRGWARVGGIEPGRIRIMAFADDRATAISEVYEIDAGDEQLVEMTVPPFGGVEVIVEAGISTAERYPVYVRLAPVFEDDPRYAVSRRKTLDSDTPMLFDRLPPGTWRVSVETEVREGRPQPLGEIDAEVRPGVTSTVDVPLTADVVRGRVVRGDEGVGARLRFDGLQPGNRRRYFAESDGEGDFLAFLSTPGLYTVKATARELGIDATVPEVEITGDEPVEIELPDGRISGTVVDEDGHTREAFVVATCTDRVGDRAAVFESKTVSGTDGIFELAGLPQGTWRVHARTGDLRSDTKSVELAPGTEMVGVQLVVRERTRVHGRLTAGGRPVSQARVIVQVLAATAELPVTHVVQSTALDGTFEIEVTERELGATALLAVFPPREPVWAVRTLLRKKLILDGPPAGGGLRIRLPARWSEAVDIQGLALVDEVWGVLPLTMLVSASTAGFTAGWAVLTVPCLAPGTWVLAYANVPRQLETALYAPLTLPTLASFQVTPGSVTEVDLTNHPLLVPKNEPDDAD